MSNPPASPVVFSGHRSGTTFLGKAFKPYLGDPKEGGVEIDMSTGSATFTITDESGHAIDVWTVGGGLTYEYQDPDNTSLGKVVRVVGTADPLVMTAGKHRFFLSITFPGGEKLPIAEGPFPVWPAVPSL